VGSGWSWGWSEAIGPAVGNRGNNGPKSAFADSPDGIAALFEHRRGREFGVPLRATPQTSS